MTQARAIADEWKAARLGGHDPVVEREAQLAEPMYDELRPRGVDAFVPIA